MNSNLGGIIGSAQSLVPTYRYWAAGHTATQTHIGLSIGPDRPRQVNFGKYVMI